jgi:hypothetical protein
MKRRAGVHAQNMRCYIEADLGGYTRRGRAEDVVRSAADGVAGCLTSACVTGTRWAMWRQGWWITRWEGTSSEAKRNELLTFWLVTRSCLAREGAQGRSFLFLRVFGFAHLPLHNAAALLSAVRVMLDDPTRGDAYGEWVAGCNGRPDMGWEGASSGPLEGAGFVRGSVTSYAAIGILAMLCPQPHVPSPIHHPPLGSH